MKITCPVVGANFRPTESRDALYAASIGTTCELEADPDNEYDSSAVRVLIDEHHVGFLPTDMNGPVFEELTEGAEVTATIISFEKPLRPIVEIEL